MKNLNLLGEEGHRLVCAPSPLAAHLCLRGHLCLLLLEIRNWTFHNPQSRMVAAKEIAEKNVPDKLKESVKIVPQLNPVIIEKVDKYELIILASLIIHVEKRIEQFEAIIKNMKSDYYNYTSKIAEQEKKLAEYEDRWYAKFSAMETALAKMQQNASAVTSLLGG